MSAAEESSATAVLPEVEPPPLKPMRGWSVLLHNDDKNEVSFVVRTVIHLARLAPGEAFERTMEANDEGASLLLVTHREHAELLQEQFQSCGLTVTIEPAP
jgi:ATP-dependent Clp protease adapter protein ClpS